MARPAALAKVALVPAPRTSPVEASHRARPLGRGAGGAAVALAPARRPAPFVKWVGGKGRLLAQLGPLLPAGVERLRLARVTPTTTEVLFEDEPSPEATAALRTRLREHRRATRPNELVRERATATFSLDEYAPLVGLGAPLDRWLLFVETTNDLDRPEHVLHLIARDGSARHELARRPAPLGPCDGGGYYCERTQDECDEAGLRAEGRLCIQPASLAHVAVADGTLALLGGVHVAGHGGYPATSWVVALPPGL